MLSIHEHEVQLINTVQQRLSTAVYDSNRHVAICFDTETSGMGATLWWKLGVVIQIACTADTPAGVREFQCSMNPFPVHVCAEAAAVHKQSNEECWQRGDVLQVGMARFLDYCLDMSEACGGATPVLVAHNMPFDMGVLQATCWRCGMPAGAADWGTFDTLRMAKRLKEKLQPANADFKLGTLAAAFGGKIGVLHEALEDARHLPTVMSGLCKAGEYPSDISTLLRTRVSNGSNGSAGDPLGGVPQMGLWTEMREKKVRSKLLKDAKQAKFSPTTSGGDNGVVASDASLSSARPDNSSAAVASGSTAAQLRRGQAVAGAAVAEAMPCAPTSVGASAGGASHAADAVGPSLGQPAPEPDHARTVPESAELRELREQLSDRLLLSEGYSRGRKESPDSFEREFRREAMLSEADISLFYSADDVSKAGRHWLPFSASIEMSGIPRKVLRAATINKLHEAGFGTILDVLRHTPRMERKENPSVHFEQHTEKLAVRGSVLSARSPVNTFKVSVLGFSIQAELTADDGLIVQREVNAAMFAAGRAGKWKLDNMYQKLLALQANDADVVFVGRFKQDKKSRRGEIGYTLNVDQFNEYVAGASPSDNDDDQNGQAVVVYPQRLCLSHAEFSRLLPSLVEHISTSLHKQASPGDACPPGDFLTCEVLEKHSQMPWLDALGIVHSPTGVHVSELDRARARERLVFNELLLLSIMMLHHRVKLRRDECDKDAFEPVTCEDTDLVDAGIAAMPFQLTTAQQRCVTEIKDDMALAVPMLRLLQGDVGTGKTAVAFLAALLAIGNGYQVAMLVPNEVLAAQHLAFMQRVAALMPEARRPSVEIVMGKTGVKARRELRERLSRGEIDILIGTTALNNSNELFQNLGLVIIDEQHRFGVKQRADLQKKNADAAPPHVLHMTATPIPRTIAMTLWSHMSVSVLDELPPGRLPIRTSIRKVPAGSSVSDATPSRIKVRERIEAELQAGGSVFWVFPLVNESEHFEDFGSVTQTYSELREAGGILGEHALLLHGAQKAEHKATILEAFRTGTCRLLISTIVIEVGIDISDATLMVVEHAERFGLLQLHQLRGRVGRSNKESECLLVTSGKQSLERLQVLQDTNDGFAVAKHDMAIRGAGQLYGQRQSGPAGIGLASLLSTTDLVRDEEVLTRARDCAADLVHKHGFKGLPGPVLSALTAHRMDTLLKLGMQDIDMHV